MRPDVAEGSLARIRHDLNNRLTAAMAEAELLLMDARDPSVREGLTRLLGELQAMGSQVSEIGREV